MSREIKFRAKVADSDYENEKQSETIGSFVHFTGFIGSENDIGYVEQLEEIPHRTKEKAYGKWRITSNNKA